MIACQPKPRVTIMSHRKSLLLALAASFLVAGCFYSESPKFPIQTAVPALGEGGRFQTYQRVEGENFRKDDVIVLRRRPDGAYALIEDKGETSATSFHPIAGGFHVGQAREKDKSRFEYVVVRVTGNEVFLFHPQCDEQDKVQMERLGVVFAGEYSCAIDSVANSNEFFAFLKLGESKTKLVRE